MHVAGVVEHTLLDQVDDRAFLREHFEGGGEVGQTRLPAAHQATMDAQARCESAARTTDVNARISGRADPIDAAEEGGGRKTVHDWGEGRGWRGWRRHFIEP